MTQKCTNHEVKFDGVKLPCRHPTNARHDAILLEIGSAGFTIRFTPTKGEWKCIPSMVRRKGRNQKLIADTIKKILERQFG